MDIGKEERDKWPRSSPFNWSEERGRCLGLSSPRLLHPSAELCFPEFGCLSGDQAQMSPQNRAGENCQPATMWKPPSLKTGEVRTGETPRESCLPSPGKVSPA